MRQAPKKKPPVFPIFSRNSLFKVPESPQTVVHMMVKNPETEKVLNNVDKTTVSLSKAKSEKSELGMAEKVDRGGMKKVDGSNVKRKRINATKGKKAGNPNKPRARGDDQSRNAQEPHEQDSGSCDRVLVVPGPLSQRNAEWAEYSNIDKKAEPNTEEPQPEENSLAPPVNQQPKKWKGPCVTEGKKEAPIPYDEYEPLSEILVEESDPDSGKYVSRMVFATDPCPENGSPSNTGDISNAVKWISERSGDYRTTVDGLISKKKHKGTGTGYHMDQAALQKQRRKSAMEKLRLWREKASIERTQLKKPRHITLEMGSPISYNSEASDWASQLAFLDSVSGPIKKLMKGSFVVIKLGLPPCASASYGHVEALIKQIRDLMARLPKHISVAISEEAAWTNVEFSAFHKQYDLEKELQNIFETPTLKEAAGEEETLSPQDRLLRLFDTSMSQESRILDNRESYRRATEMAYGNPVSDSWPYAQIEADTQARYRELEDIWRNTKIKTYEEQNARVDKYVELCKEFIREVQLFRDHGILPGQNPNPELTNIPDKIGNAMAKIKAEEMDTPIDAPHETKTTNWLQPYGSNITQGFAAPTSNSISHAQVHHSIGLDPGQQVNTIQAGRQAQIPIMPLQWPPRSAAMRPSPMDTTGLPASPVQQVYPQQQCESVAGQSNKLQHIGEGRIGPNCSPPFLHQTAVARAGGGNEQHGMSRGVTQLPGPGSSKKRVFADKESDDQCEIDQKRLKSES